MADLSAAIAAAREALARYENLAECSADYDPCAHEITGKLSDILAALDAARGEAVAWRCTGDEVRCFDGNGCECAMNGNPPPDTPPAALAVPDRGFRRACVRIQRETALADAVQVVLDAMRADPEYAWSWHCNVVMAFVDEGGDHATANHAAARFMRLLANVEPAHELPAKQAPPAAVPANVRERWNIERDGNALRVCFNNHEKGEACEYVRYVPEAPPAAVPAETREHVARLLELSDRHLTGGEFAIQRGNVYWQAQAQVAIDALAAALAERKKENP